MHHAGTARVDCRPFFEQVSRGLYRAQNDHGLSKRFEIGNVPVFFGPICIGQPGIIVRYIADESKERYASGSRRRRCTAGCGRSPGTNRTIDKKDEAAKEGER